MTRTIANDEIEVQADFSQASCPLRFRVLANVHLDDEWMATPYQVADAGHDFDRALDLVSDWAEAQS